MNLGIPSIIIKMLRQKFDQQWSVRKSESTEEERTRMLNLLSPSAMKMDARLKGSMLSVEQLMALNSGDVLMFDYPVNRPLDLIINGTLKFRGHVFSTGRKRAFLVESIKTSD